jgi:excisionase family DNA binding protein
MEKKLITVPKAARENELHKETIWRLIRAGRLPAYRFGRALRVDPDELRAVCKLKSSS